MAATDDRPRISAFVITCDKDADTLSAVLKAARFTDELILVDKGHRTARWHGVHVDYSYRVPWSPTVEETRVFAVTKCHHNWVVCLDDDEILSQGCVETFWDFIRADRAEVLMVPIKHYILGRFDERAYYWPEWRPCLFRHGELAYTSTVHGGTNVFGSFERLREGHEAFITHLSHPDVATWIEKTNRYTSQPDRAGMQVPPSGQLVGWAINRLGVYLKNGSAGDDYQDAVAILRGIYDVVDGLKRWEATQSDGHEAFRKILKGLEMNAYEEN